MTDFRVGGESFVVLSYPGCSRAIGAGLTSAERSVAMAAAQGKTNAEIAARRRVSERTVANQMAAILQKLGLRSRLDLAGDLRARPSGGRGGLS